MFDTLNVNEPLVNDKLADDPSPKLTTIVYAAILEFDVTEQFT